MTMQDAAVSESTATGATAPFLDMDHAGYIVPDLQAAGAFMAQLGFTLTARADHTRTNAQGELVSAGSAQHSLMLRRGYLELMEIYDPSAGHQLASAVTVRHGLHVVAFGNRDADACHARCTAAGVPVGPLLHWARPVQEPDIAGLAKFAYFGSDWQPEDPSYLCWVEHRTPGLLRSERLLRHPNRALGLEALRYSGPRALAHAWARQLAAATGVAWDEAAGTLVLPGFRFHIAIDDRAEQVRPQVLQLAFDGLDALRERCAAMALPTTQRADGMLDIDLTPQLGMHWHCRDASQDAG